MKPLMRTFASAALTAVAIFGASAQNPYADSYEVNRMDTRPIYRQGQVIVKFKTDDSAAKTTLRKSKAGVKAQASATALNSLLEKYGAADAEELMPLTGAKVTPKRMLRKGLNGATVEDTDLSALYLLRLDAAKAANLGDVIAEFKALPEVEYAEPNYIVRTCELSDASSYTSDPLYSQQWSIPALNLDKLWQQPVTDDERPVIAILDTGVDITHPDLADNIWTNPLEAEGAEGSDDDGNGFADDIHGWDFIFNRPQITDFNGHGTHCAGIAAAVGGNGIGITGANPDALIMPLVVMQTDGTGDIGTIIKGVDYARANGADVISMSFGMYSHALALHDALGKAYQNSLLVAAAGNDGVALLPPPAGAPCFPAAYTFVVGVMASDQNNQRTSFTNQDLDGPLVTQFSQNEMMYNYEITAPGVNIMSTYRNGTYKSLNGTSMACPLVAGALSRLYMCKDIATKELLFGDLIHSLNGGLMGVFDVMAAYGITDADRTPTLAIVSTRIEDKEGGDGDNRPDAGEIIDIYPTIRNFWGQARNVKLTLSIPENENPDMIEIISSDVAFDSELSSYSLNETKNPVRFRISDQAPDGLHVRVILTATCDNVTEPVSQEFTYTVENGIELSGLIWKDTTLYPDKYYIVTTNVGITEGVTLTLMPGTKLYFKPRTGISVEKGKEEFITVNGVSHCYYPNAGKIIAEGTPDKRILLTASEETHLGSSDIKITTSTGTKFKYVEFSNFAFQEYIDSPIEKCIINYNQCTGAPDSLFECAVLNNGPHNVKTNYAKNSTISRNYSNYWYDPEYIGVKELRSCNTFGNYINDASQKSYVSLQESSYVAEFRTTDEPNYYGSTNLNILRDWIWDIKNPQNITTIKTFAEADLSNMLTRPNAKAPGCVWKVEVDGYNACDDFDMLPDLGVGRHKFEVFFSKRMNRAKTPMVAMGVRSPYTQTAIAEDASWRQEVYENGDTLDIYTAYLTIKGSDAFDGLNRIYVGETEDIEYFPVPIEDFRFNVNVQSAGSMSAGFVAEAGVGRVNLSWESPEEYFDDMLGYNLYRYTLDENFVSGDTIRVNEDVLTTEAFTDYNITPGTTYNYFYKVLRTSLTENSPSRVVSATPRAAGKGDADASGAVDVADVVTEVNYMVGRDPKPFIFEAADINNDSEVDILDVVGTVNIILRPEGSAAMAAVSSSASYEVVDGVVYVDSPVELAGVQMLIRGEAGRTEISVLPALNGMENTGAWTAADEYKFISFSLSGRTVAPGRSAMLRIGDATLEDIILVDSEGKRVYAVNESLAGIGSVTMEQMRVPSPNPFTDELAVPVTLASEGDHDVVFTLTTLDGRMAWASAEMSLERGEHSLTLRPAGIAPGFYLLTMVVDGKAVQACKVVKK